MIVPFDEREKEDGAAPKTMESNLAVLQQVHWPDDFQAEAASSWTHARFKQ
jgi:hypothetical protein